MTSYLKRRGYLEIGYNSEMKETRLPSFIGVFILIAGITSGVILIKNNKNQPSKAKISTTPKDVRVTNIDSSSASISWVTDEQTHGSIKISEKSKSVNGVRFSKTQEPGFIHYVSLTNLKPNSKYFFNVVSDETTFDNNSYPWQFETAPVISDKPQPVIIRGTVLQKNRTPVAGVVVYATAGSGNFLSALTDQDGSWLIPLSNIRSQTLDSYISIDMATTLVELSVQAGLLGVSTAQIYPQSANPSPPLVLGQTHNYKSLKPQDLKTSIPEAVILLPTSEIKKVMGETATQNTENTSLGLDEYKISNSSGPLTRGFSFSKTLTTSNLLFTINIAAVAFVILILYFIKLQFRK